MILFYGCSWGSNLREFHKVCQVIREDLYAWCLSIANICIAWFLDIGISTCSLLFDYNTNKVSTSVFLIRSYGTRRYFFTQCYDKTWATLAHKVGWYC